MLLCWIHVTQISNQNKVKTGPRSAKSVTLRTLPNLSKVEFFRVLKIHECSIIQQRFEVHFSKATFCVR